jgi:nucleotide-binding universal stress UspA family protein
MIMYKNILFPIDISEESSWKIALTTVLELAQAFKPTVHVLSVVPEYGMRVIAQFFPENAEDMLIKNATEALHQFTKHHIPDAIDTRHIVTQGTVYEAILNIADHCSADVIVMAASRPKLQNYLLGSNTAHVVRHASRSVLVVRNTA